MRSKHQHQLAFVRRQQTRFLFVLVASVCVLALTSCVPAVSLYLDLQKVHVIAPVVVMAGIKGVDTPYELQPFVSAFSDQLLPALGSSSRIGGVSVETVAHSAPYRAIAAPTAAHLVSISGLGDLSEARESEVAALRSALSADALLLVSIEYSVVELLYWTLDNVKSTRT